MQTRDLDKRKIDNIYDTVVRKDSFLYKRRHRTIVVHNWTKFTGAINKTFKMKSVVALLLAVFCLSMVSIRILLTNKNLDFAWSRNFLFDLILLLISISENNTIHRYIVICDPTMPKSIEMSKFYVEKLFYFFIAFLFDQ